MFFSRKLKVNSNRVLEKIRKVSGRRLSGDSLYLLRYVYGEDKISRYNFKHLEATTEEFLNSFAEEGMRYLFPDGIKEISLSDPAIFMTGIGNKTVILKVYCGEQGSSTVQVSNFNILSRFRDSLSFIQEGKLCSFENLQENQDIVAIKPLSYEEGELVIHYVPGNRG